MLKQDVINEIDSLELSELKELEHYVSEEISRRRRLEAVSAIVSIADEAGIDLYKLAVSEVISVTEPDRKSEAVEKRYCHPENPNLVWNGRGRHPLWFKNLVRNGVPPESLRRSRDTRSGP